MRADEESGRRFNEAGAIMPRSGLTGAPICGLIIECFNEAGAIMPRSGKSHWAAAVVRELASMRPGQSCPGVAGIAIRLEAIRQKLQ